MYVCVTLSDIFSNTHGTVLQISEQVFKHLEVVGEGYEEPVEPSIFRALFFGLRVMSTDDAYLWSRCAHDSFFSHIHLVALVDLSPSSAPLVFASLLLSSFCSFLFSLFPSPLLMQYDLSVHRACRRVEPKNAETIIAEFIKGEQEQKEVVFSFIPLTFVMRSKIMSLRGFRSKLSTD